MAYNRMNILKHIIDVQNTTIEHTARGVSQQWVYENIIYPRYVISIGTYYSYLSCNAKSELKKIETAKAEQLSLCF